MRVLVTRPLEDANTTAAQLSARGHSALISPLLSVVEFAGPPVDLSGVQAILATSANGVRALARRNIDRNLPVFAVGPQTAKEARDAGFSLVRDANGDLNALAESITLWTSPDKGTLLHASGVDGAGKLATLLEGRGFTVRTETLYAVSAAPLTAEARKALSERLVDAVMLYSPRSARLFQDVVKDDGLEAGLDFITAVCISAATAQMVMPLSFKEIRIAESPNQDAMLACLG